MTPTPNLMTFQRRDCFFDENGNEQCDGLTYTTRIIIGLAIAGGFALLFLAFSILATRRKRRMAQMSSFTPSAIPTYVQPYQTENDQWNHAGQSTTYTQQPYYPPTPQQKNSFYAPPAGPPPPLEEPYHPEHLSMPPPSYQRRDSGKV